MTTETMEMTAGTTEAVSGVGVKATKTCPKCQKEISAVPGPYARHVKHCKGAVIAEVTPNAEIDLSQITDDEVRKVMQQAIKTQEAMRRSPQAFVNVGLEDEHLVLRKTYAPETLERFDVKGRPLHTHTAYIGRSDQLHVDVGRGYVPVLNEQGQFVRNRGGDILYKIDRRISQAKIEAAGRESRDRLARITENTVARNASLHDGDLHEESFGAVGTLTLTEDDRTTTSGE